MAFYQQEPFYNPQIPFTGSIQGGLQVGKKIIISGQVLPGAQRFHVNLQCGSRAKADVALHFNPRYDGCSGCIVINAHQHSSWGTEERISGTFLPKGSAFTLLIHVMQDSFKISVNNKHVKDFKHRIPFKSVDTVVVNGMVVINSIAFQNPESVCPPQPGFSSVCPPQPGFSSVCPPQPGFSATACRPSANYCMPYKTIINGGLKPGRNLTIQGTINPDASSFCISLRHRNGIAFAYNPRFNENVVVCNTLAQQWGPEERSGLTPYQRGQNIQIVISCNPYHYNVFLNGQQMLTYIHRFTRLQDIDVLEVTGDLRLSSVDVMPHF